MADIRSLNDDLLDYQTEEESIDSINQLNYDDNEDNNEDDQAEVDDDNKYHNINCCEWTRGLDNLLDQYNQDNRKIVSLMVSDPDLLIKTIWKPEGPLAIDQHCRCQMGTGDIRSSFACAQCKNLRRLIDFRDGAINRPFKLECGDYAGVKLIVFPMSVTSPFLQWDDDATRRAKIYIQQYQETLTCGTPDMQGIRCAIGDPFTTHTLINIMINDRFAELDLPHIPKLHTAFICRGMGYSVFTLPTIGPISNLIKNKEYLRGDRLLTSITRSIILQLLVTCLELSQMNFSHGNPSLNGLLFDQNPVSYLHDGVRIQGPITLQIADLINSSATFDGVHYFPRNMKASIYTERNIFVPEITNKVVSMGYCQDLGQDLPRQDVNDVCHPTGTTLYKLSTQTLGIYNAIRHIGFPLYVGSFDFYCFMVALMTNREFYLAINSDEDLYKLWSMMWLIEDLSLIDERLRVYHNNPRNDGKEAMTVDLIKGLWLRCDIVKYIWSLIKQGW